MKGLILSVALLAASLTSGYAQQKEVGQKRSAEERAKQITEALDKKLNLSANQETKIYDLYLDRAKKMEKMREQRMEEKKDRIEKNRQTLADHDKKLEKILNADQFKLYQEQRNKAKQNMKKRHPHKRDGRMQKDKV